MSFNIVLILITLLLILDQIKYRDIYYKSKYLNFAFWTAIIGGIILDIYSIFPQGFFLVCLLCTLFIFRKFVKAISTAAVINIFLIAILANIIYQITFLGLGWLTYFLNLHQINIMIDKLYLINFLISTIVNSLLIVFGFLIIKIVRKDMNLKK